MLRLRCLCSRLAAAQSSTCTGCGQARGGPFLDKAPLELRQAREDVKQELTRGRSGVDGAAQQGPKNDATVQACLA